MFGRLLPLRLGLLIIQLLCLVAGGLAQNTQLSQADQLYEAGRFAEAQAAYKAVLKTDPNSAAAQAGLVRSQLRQEKIDEARETVNKAVAAQPNSAVLQSALGDVQFRFAQMGEAEASYIKAKKLDPKEVHSYLGLVELYVAYSFYRRAYDQLQRAHDIAPANVEVQRLWMGTLPRKQRLAALQAYLARPHPEDPAETAAMQRHLAFLQATVDKQVHPCKLAGNIEQTATPLEMMGSAKIIHGVGLMVKLNGHGARLLLDTGAGGILVTRHIAEKAGLTRLTSTQLGGIGDKGEQSGYIAVADNIRIGDLEFHDCLVEVADRGLESEDGLVGANVFGRYLIDIDIPGMKLKLSPLPKRPDEAFAETSLATRGDNGLAPEEETETNAEANSADDKKDSTAAPKAPARLPHDRYVAPEMTHWTKIFRFGHMLLVPTRVNESQATLFLIDTGSSLNLISTRAALEATKIHSDDRVRIHGVSGDVKQVYSTGQFTLQFGRYRQKNQDAVSFDFSNMNKRTGTEVSGILGFATWKVMEVKIDYRDGLVDFLYDPARVPAYNRR
jgi:tetratricopeptide (TPR) repeat protein